MSLKGKIRRLVLVRDVQAFHHFCDYDDFTDEVSVSVMISIKVNEPICLTHSFLCLRVLVMMSTEILTGTGMKKL